MNITLEKVKAALREEDVESLIEFGAPTDEYDSEAEIITKALKKLSVDEMHKSSVASIVATVWEQTFHRSPEELSQRKNAFENIALRIIGI